MKHHPSRVRAGVLLLAASVALATACSDSTEPEDTGTVTGVVTAPNGTTPIPGATVTLQSGTAGNVVTLDDVRFSVMANQGAGPSTTTAGDGSFTLENVPAGTQTLLATKGNFSATMTVDVVANQATELASPMATTTVLDMLFVPGSYDRIQDIAEEALGIEQLTQIAASDLNDAATYDGTGVILLNCGMSTGSITDTGRDLLRNFMENGGIVYASDLTYSFVRSLFADDLSGGGSGSSGTVQADVIYAEMEDFLGTATVEINYNLGGWARPAYETDLPVTMLIGAEGSAQDGNELAFMLQPQGFGGGLIFTSFHNQAQLTEEMVDMLSYFLLALY